MARFFQKKIVDHIVPVWDIPGENNDTCVLITAGMDGDEYAGIEAAFQLIEYYQKHLSSSRIVILPIVNMSGFEKQVSWNPEDGKFPKHIFPGKKNGTASEKCIHWIWESFGKKSDVWIDLHGGATHEELEPFVWGFPARKKNIEELSKKIVSGIGHNRNLIASWKKAENIQRVGCVYVVFEAGERGEVKKDWVNLHVQWIQKAIISITSHERSKKELSYWSGVTYSTAPYSGFWKPSENISRGLVKEGETIGRLADMSKKTVTDIRVKKSGAFLWKHVGYFVKKGDVLLAVGY